MERRGSIYVSFDTETKEQAELIITNLISHLRTPRVIPAPVGYFNAYTGGVATIEELNEGLDRI